MRKMNIFQKIAYGMREGLSFRDAIDRNIENKNLRGRFKRGDLVRVEKSFYGFRLRNERSGKFIHFENEPFVISLTDVKLYKTGEIVGRLGGRIEGDELYHEGIKILEFVGDKGYYVGNRKYRNVGMIVVDSYENLVIRIS